MLIILSNEFLLLFREFHFLLLCEVSRSIHFLFLHIFLLLNYRIINQGGKYSEDCRIRPDHLFRSQFTWYCARQKWIGHWWIFFTFLERGFVLAHDLTESLHSLNDLSLIVNVAKVGNGHEVIVFHHCLQHIFRVLAPLFQVKDFRVLWHPLRNGNDLAPERGALLAEDVRRTRMNQTLIIVDLFEG